MARIGEPLRIIEVEPLEFPQPEENPLREDPRRREEPAEPETVPAEPDKEKEPV